MIELENTIEFLKEFLKKEDTIVIGVSGGSDSMCLLSLLLQLNKEYNLNIICAHVNHKKRIESDEEAEFVSRFCQKNNCIFEYIELNFSTQTDFENQARKKRYKFYEQLVEKYHAKYLMTAHHGDDLVETILMRLTRGSNLHGYAGFKKITDFPNYKLVRPLIYVTKNEIEDYNKIHKIEYRIDASNEDDHYTRNRYRHYMLPFLKKENRNIHKKFLKFSEELDLVDKFLDKETKIALTSVCDSDKVNLHKFKKLDLVIKKRVIEYVLKEEYQSNINCINEKHLKLVLDICNSNKANQKINLPMHRTLIKDYNFLYFSHNKRKLSKEYILEDKLKIEDLGRFIKIDKTDILKSNYILRLNSQEIQLPLKVRTRKEADRISVKNLHGIKKIKDIFINEKIPVEKRDNWPIVVDSNDTILWIPGLKKSHFDKNIDEFYDIIYKYVISEEKKDEEK